MVSRLEVRKVLAESRGEAYHHCIAYTIIVYAHSHVVNECVSQRAPVFDPGSTSGFLLLIGITWLHWRLHVLSLPQ